MTKPIATVDGEGTHVYGAFSPISGRWFIFLRRLPVRIHRAPRFPLLHTYMFVCFPPPSSKHSRSRTVHTYYICTTVCVLLRRFAANFYSDRPAFCLPCFSPTQGFIELPGAGHCPMDETPHLTDPVVLDFVAKHYNKSSK